MVRTIIALIALATGVVILSFSSSAQTPLAAAPHTQVVLLGTGDPAADPDQSGPATAIVLNNTAYLVDFGAGVVRRAKAAATDRGIRALEPTNLRNRVRHSPPF